MKQRTRQRGIGLVECFVYVAVVGILMNLLCRVFVTGFRAHASAEQAVHAVQQAEIVLESLRHDLKQAVDVQAAWPAGLSVAGAEAGGNAYTMIRFPNGRGVAYALQGGCLRRYELAGNEADAGQAARKTCDFAGRFDDLTVTRMAGAHGVFRIDFRIDMGPMGVAGRRARRPARFATAVYAPAADRRPAGP